MAGGTDPYVAAEPASDAGHLHVTLASGRTVRFYCTVPVDGVLRLQAEPPEEPGAWRFPRWPGTPPEPPATGDRPRHPPPRRLPDPVLCDLPDHPARLDRTPEGTVITGPGVRAVWRTGGPGGSPAGDAPQDLRFGGFHRFSEPEGSTLPFRAGHLPATADHPAGWVETIELAPDRAVYGGGESYQGPDLRGRRRRLRNIEEHRAAGRDSAYLNVPLLWSDAGWGVFVHSGGPIEADLGATHAEAARITVLDDRLDLFLLHGDAPGILRRYLRLTGRPRQLPPWAYGVWMSRSSYFTADEVTDTVAELERAGCPVDVVHVDEWLTESVLDEASWTAGPDRRRFPAGWTRRLAERGVRTSLWINPYLTRGTPLAEELHARGYLLRNADGDPATTTDNPRDLLLDFLNPRARAWWCQRLAETLRQEGNAAVMADFGEEIPDDAVFADGSTGTERHNTYPLFYQETVREAGRLARGEDFVALSRSGTAGSQRTPVQWAGDLPSTWSGLVSSLRAVLSMSLSGFLVVTHDAGGYWTPASYHDAEDLRRRMAPGEVRADVEPELYGRWAQFAAFSPLMRFHGTGRREPTAYPEPARGAAIAACRLRRQLQRYLTEAARDELPLLRPMPLAFPGDRAARDATLQYLLGPHLLVAPLLAPGGRRELYVPPGEWEPLLGAPPLTGPGWREVTCGPRQFPAYVRAEVGAHTVLDGTVPSGATGADGADGAAPTGGTPGSRAPGAARNRR